MKRLSFTLIDFAVIASVGLLCGCTATEPLKSGNGLLICGCVAVAVGAWFLARRHGNFRGQLSAAQNRLETKQGDL